MSSVTKANRTALLGWFLPARITWVFKVLLLLGVSCLSPALAALDSHSDFDASLFIQSFHRQSAVMLLIDPNNGDIVDANRAAAKFYGYSPAHLRNLKVQDLNTFSAEQLEKEIQLAKTENRSHFLFRHQLADGSTRKVSVNAVPIHLDGKVRIFSIISELPESSQRFNAELLHYQKQLEEMLDLQAEEIRSKGRLIILAMSLAIAFLFALMVSLYFAYHRSHRMRQRALANEATLKSIFNNISDCLIFTDTHHRVIKLNQSAVETFGFSINELKNQNIARLFADYYSANAVSPPHAFTSEARIDLQEFRYRTKQGRFFTGETSGAVIEDRKGEVLGHIRVIRDITHRKIAEKELRLAASVYRNTSEGIVLVSSEGQLIDANQAYSAITGFSQSEVIGKHVSDVFPTFQDKAFFIETIRALNQQGQWQGEVEILRKSGPPRIGQFTTTSVQDEAGHHKQFVVLFFDITDKKIQEQQLKHVAHYDALTGLANRLLLAERLNESMQMANHNGKKLATAYIDLDGFKAINDTWGHPVGDQLLVEVSKRMKQSLRDSDTLARLGGDEFVAVINDLSNEFSHETYLTRLLNAASQPVMIEGKALRVSASLGVTFYPQPEEINPDQLLRQADQAMYQAKLHGKGCFHIFDQEHDRNIKGKNEGLARLRQALENDELVLYYQPKVNMRSGQFVGVEALLRWQHPERGLVPPLDFLPLIEDHPLAIDVGEWVIRTALQQLSQWHSEGLYIVMSVNIGSKQLQQPDFSERLQCFLKQFPEIDPKYLDLEALESSAMNDLNAVSHTMVQCSEGGVSFSLDDFGTGYSSLSYLRHLPAQYLKIDRSFVIHMLEDADDLAILKGVLGLACVFQRQAIAEGVETIEHGTQLLLLGCELAQGFGIAKPMPGEKILSWALTWRPPKAWSEVSSEGSSEAKKSA